MTGERNEVAVVTGGASGIGEATARRYARDGFLVAIVDQSEERAKAVAGDLNKSGTVVATAHACDVADLAAQVSIAAAIERDVGPVTRLVTSAGIINNASTMLDMDLDEHRRVWDVNYSGTLYSVKAFAPAMQQRRRGAICTIASVNSFIQLPLPAYNPSKAAIKRLTELLAMELGRFGVRINAVAPTYTMTPAIKARIASGQRDPENMKRSGAIHMLVEPEHVANAIAFLTSDEAIAITGSTLPVDAGYLVAAYYQTYAGGLPWKD